MMTSDLCSGIISGTVSGLVSGFIVGIALWRLDLASEKRRRLYEGKGEVAKKLKSVVANASRLGKEPHFNGRALATLAPDTREIREQIDLINPVLVGQLRLASVPAWKAACRFVESVELLYKRAVDVDNLVRRVVRATYHSLKISTANDPEAQLYVNCRLLGWEEKDIIPHLWTGELDHVPEHALQCWEAVNKDKNWASLTAEFKQALAEMEDNRGRLAECDPNEGLV